MHRTAALALVTHNLLKTSQDKEDRPDNRNGVSADRTKTGEEEEETNKDDEDRHHLVMRASTLRTTLIWIHNLILTFNYFHYTLVARILYTPCLGSRAII